MRRRVGFVIINIYNSYLSTVWPGASEAAKERGLDLILLPGGQMNSPDQRDRQESYIYEFLARGGFDGFIFASNVFGSTNTIEDLSRFCARIAPLPYVCLGTRLPGAPTVMIDNAAGLKDLTTHFVERHGYRKFGYIRGPVGQPEADQRYATVKAVLESHGLALDESLVFKGDFNEPAGLAAGRFFLERRNKVEAVLAANDIMAIACMRELERSGVHVPDDIALGGFDDIFECGTQRSPLSTVRQPIYGQSHTAMEILARMMDGEKGIPDVVLPTEAVIRCSCGCTARAIEEVTAAAGDLRQEDLSLDLESLRERVGFDVKAATALAERIVAHDGDADDAAGILKQLDDLMHSLPGGGGEYELWNDYLNHVYAIFICSSRGTRCAAALNLFQKMRIAVGDYCARSEAAARVASTQEFVALQEALRGISSDFEMSRLIEDIGHSLCSVGIETFYLCVYPEFFKRAPGDWVFPPAVRLALGQEDGAVSRLQGNEFDPRLMLPRDAGLGRAPGTHILHPLYAGEEHYGYLMCRMGPRNGTLYETLRAQVSSSFQAARILIDQKRQEEGLESVNVRLRELAMPMLTAIRGVSGIAVERIRRLAELIERSAAAAATLDSANQSVRRVVENARDMKGLIAMIEDISVNINLLSINASIESARAGIHGKGFAVISGEIRKMASGTAENARKTSLSLSSTMEYMDAAGRQSAEAVAAYQALDGELKALSASFAEISEKMEELERMSREMGGILE